MNYEIPLFNSNSTNINPLAEFIFLNILCILKESKYPINNYQKLLKNSISRHNSNLTFIVTFIERYFTLQIDNESLVLSLFFS